MASPSKYATLNPGKTQYIYKMDALTEEPDNDPSCEVMLKRKLSGKSSSEGGALFGDKVIVGLIHKAAGTGSKRHTHPNEQFSFVLEGALLYEFEDQDCLVTPGTVIHIPANVVHSSCATGDGEALFFVCKDVRGGLAGPQGETETTYSRYGGSANQGRRRTGAARGP